MRQIGSYVLAAALLAAVGGLSGCNVSHDIARNGSGAGTLLWPSPNSTSPLNKDGTWPALATLRRIAPGMNKHQLISLIGSPQFNEGFWGVREWDYLFHLRQPDGKVEVCQYKVLFDHHYLARSFWWKPASCADLLKPPPKPKPVVAKAVQVFTLSADALFGFNRWSIADIRSGGRTQLDDLAHKILQHRDAISSISVLGYTDRLGSDAYNDTLSQQRADAVMAYLTDQGVPADLMTAKGLGKSDPVTTGCTDMARAALIACLAPDRRVTVQVDRK